MENWDFTLHRPWIYRRFVAGWIFRQSGKTLRMRWYRYLSCGLPGMVLLVVTGALARQVGLPAPPVPAGPVDDPEAIRILDRTMDALGPGHIAWLQCAVRQRVQLPGLAFQGEGMYCMGPDHRFRMEVRTQLGGAEGMAGPDGRIRNESVGTLLIVSDGVNLWQASRAGDGPWAKVTRLNLPDALATINGATVANRVRSEFFESPTFTGVGTLVRQMRGCLIWVRQERVRRPEGDRVELTSVWPVGRLRELAPSDKPWPIGLPRRCVLSLDAATLWPYRVEWWGPGPEQDEAVLAEIEFRDPIANRPLSPEQCAEVFSFEPGEVEVEDRTADVTNHLSTRAQQLAVEEASRR